MSDQNSKRNWKIIHTAFLFCVRRGKINDDFWFWLPRYGYRLNFSNNIASVNYFGFGPDECYEDKREYATLDWYDYTIDDSKNSYEKPQECNSRVGTKWLNFSVDGINFNVSSNNFSFNITNYDVNENWKVEISNIGVEELRYRIPAELNVEKITLYVK